MSIEIQTMIPQNVFKVQTMIGDSGWVDAASFNSEEEAREHMASIKFRIVQPSLRLLDEAHIGERE